jgi:hypothetical protein
VGFEISTLEPPFQFFRGASRGLPPNAARRMRKSIGGRIPGTTWLDGLTRAAYLTDCAFELCDSGSLVLATADTSRQDSE